MPRSLTKERRSRSDTDPVPLGRAIDRKARELLVEARMAAGLTQYQLADRLGRRQSYVSRIERGTQTIDRADFLAMARALDVDPHELFAKVIVASEHSSKPRQRIQSRR